MSCNRLEPDKRDSLLQVHVTIWLHTLMQILAALADPIRREIVEVLLEHPQDAGTIARRFPVSRPAVSRHLRVLRETGIVRSETIAQRRVYHIETAPLKELDDWLTHFRQFWTDRLAKLEEHLERGD